MIEVSPSSSLSCGADLALVVLLQARRVGLGRGHLLVDLLAAAGALADAHADRSALDVFSTDRRRGSAACRSGRRPSRSRRGSGAGRSMMPPGRDLRAAHAARVVDRARRRVPLDDVEVLDDRRAAARARLEHAALLAASLPRRTATRSPFFTFMVWPWSEHLRSKADDLHEVLLAQLARDRPEDARAARVALVVDDHGGVLVECDRACRRCGRTASSSARRPRARPRPS